MKAPIDSLLHPLYVSPRLLDFNPFEPFPGSGRSPWKGPRTEPRSHAMNLTHIALDIEVDEAKRSVSGRARLTLTAYPSAGGVREVVLDAFELRVSRVRIERGRRSRALRFRSEGGTLRVLLDRACAAGETVTLAITYASTPRKGLFFIQPDARYPEKPWQVWSQGQAEDNHAWFPCIDGPDTKVTSEIRVTVDARRTAVSNGRLLRTERATRGRRTFHWKQNRPHATYLIMLAVGDYRLRTARAGKVALSFYEYADRSRASRRLFSKTAAMMRFFSERFGYAYPWDKYAQVLLHDFTFGGMENTSATTLTDRALLDDRALADYSYDSLVAHELGHQWWGDLVTCRSWSDGWLNEGFATYCERLWEEHEHGADEAALAGLAELNQYMQQDAKHYRRPIVTKTYEKANELFDRHLYEKGGLTLHLLRHVLGDEAFFRALTHYAQANAHGTVLTHDLDAAIRASTGQSLTWFFDQWLHRAGYPELKVTRGWDPRAKVLTVRVEQRQTTDELTPVFRFPLDVEVDAGSARPRTFRFWVEKTEETFHIPLTAEPRRVTLDPAEAVIKTLDYDRSAAELALELAHARSALRRMRAARDLAAYPTPSSIATLRRVLTRDRQWGVRVAAAIALGEIGASATDTRAVRALHAGLEDAEGRVRRAVVWALAHAGARDLEAVCVETLAHDRSYLTVVMALLALGHRRTEQAYDIITSTLTRTSPNEIVRSAALDALGILKDKRGFDVALEWSAYGRPPGAREAGVKLLGTLGKHLGGAEAGRAKERLLELLGDASFRTRLAAIRGLTLLGDRSAVDAMRQAQRRECLDQTVLALRDAIEELESPAPAAK